MPLHKHWAAIKLYKPKSCPLMHDFLHFHVHISDTMKVIGHQLFSFQF